MLYGFAILLVAGACYVAYLFLLRHYSQDKASPSFDMEANACKLPKQVRVKVQFIGALSLLLSIVGFAVLLVGLVSL